MTHAFRNDTRINVIKNIITPFQIHLNDITKICQEQNYLWDSIYADDTEHFVGTVFIVLQNYINSSILDLYPDSSKLHEKYSLDKKINTSQVTRIELIIAIANYYKHRDLPTELHKGTSQPLNDLDLDYKEIVDIENNIYFHKMGATSPVFNGLSLLSELWVFSDLIDIVSEWRENLWLIEEKKQK